MVHIRCLITLLLVLLAGCTPQPPPTSDLTGKVVSVADGDTLTILVGVGQHTIRLHGIDTPEHGQPFGTRAKQFTSSAAFGKVVSVQVTDVDRYGREVRIVTLPDGSNLNHALVKAGMAWHYVQYAPDDDQLAAIEETAREAQAGLWADPDPIPPWKWRKGTRPPGATEGGYWLNLDSNTRHNSTCKWYQNTSAGRPCKATEGRACGVCGG